MCVVFLILLICVTRNPLTSAQGLKLQLSGPTTIVQGRNVVLTCSAENAENLNKRIYFHRRYADEDNVYNAQGCFSEQNGSTCTGSQQSAPWGYRCDCGDGSDDAESNVKKYTITLVNGNVKHEGSWFCMSDDFIKSNYVNITLDNGSFSVSLSGNDIQYDVGQSGTLRLTCRTSVMIGQAEITWLNTTDGGIIMNTAPLVHEDGVYSQVLTLIPELYQNKNTIQCSASNIQTNKTVWSNILTLNLVRLKVQLSGPTTIIEGRNVVLTCSVENAENLNKRIYFFRRYADENYVYNAQGCFSEQNGSTCTGSQQSAPWGYRCDCGDGSDDAESNVKKYTITLVKGNVKHEGSWFCMPGFNKSNYVNITVIYGPLNASVTGNKPQFDADGVRELRLTCTTSVMVGQAEITWLNTTDGGIIMNTAPLVHNDGVYSQVLTLTPHWYQHQTTIQCSASNIQTNKTVWSNIVTLDLVYPPIDKPAMTGYTEPVQEGHMLDLTCKVTGGNPPVSTIIINCDGVGGSSTHAGQFSFIATRSFHKHTCHCSAVHLTGRYHLTTSITVFVKYAPSVKVYSTYDSTQKTRVVICEAEGYPGNYSFFSFTHYWGEHTIRTLTGEFEEPNKYVLSLSSYTYRDEGSYECRVTNGVEGPNKLKVQNGFVPLNDAIPGIVDDTKKQETVVAALGERVLLIKIIYTKSNITSHAWKNELGQSVQDKWFAVEVTLNIHDTHVQDVGYTMTLNIPNLQKDDLGLYELDVCNTHGCGQFYTTLILLETTGASTSDSILVPAVSGAVVGVVILVIIVIAVYCFVKRRNLKPNNGSANKDARQRQTQHPGTVGGVDAYSTLGVRQDSQYEKLKVVGNPVYSIPDNEDTDAYVEPNNKNNPKTVDDVNIYSTLDDVKDNPNQDGNLHVYDNPAQQTESTDHENYYLELQIN